MTLWHCRLWRLESDLSMTRYLLPALFSLSLAQFSPFTSLPGPTISREFSSFTTSFTNPGQLERIGKETLRSVLCSDYLQCSEAELVAATVRWGELRCCTVLCVL